MLLLLCVCVCVQRLKHVVREKCVNYNTNEPRTMYMCVIPKSEL